MFHLAGFTESQDSATLVNVAAADDDALTVSGDDIIVPADFPLVIGAAVLGPNTDRAILRSPSITATRTAFELTPIDIAALPTGAPKRFIYLAANPLELVPAESLNAQAAESAAGAARSTIMVWLSDAAPTPVEGAPIRKVRFTAAVAAVANVWSSMPITLTDNLEAGRYALIGAHCRSTNLQFFRFVLRNQVMRPGGIGDAAASGISPEGQRNGGWGTWGEFEHNEVPRLEVLANGADAAFTGELDLVKLT